MRMLNGDEVVDLQQLYGCENELCETAAYVQYIRVFHAIVRQGWARDVKARDRDETETRRL